jgi:formate--tetrahydrofolate ligase
VATLRALKLHGGVALANVEKPNPEAVAKGVGNLAKHIENVRLFGLEPVVAINRFPSDTEEEIGVLGEWCSSFGVKWALSDVWAKGGAGATDLAHLVVKAAGRASKFAPIYPLEASIRHKIEKVATLVYGAEEVEYSPAARTQIKALEEHGYASLPICVAKTQYSLSDNPKLLGRPHGFTVHVREAKVSAGAGFIVVYAGSILTMPGLPKEPAAFRMGLDANGNVFGLS